ncbi:WecB/TagA/CpsF family glycosyltransferase [Clostridium sp. Marseille-P3244]|uniref:WecB/TagA/CpsF family glycosyltransferase n=1 Tax=Clostridium sp. Marseille-P3244 TaxID=1871020 RepID=UPI00116056C4|nr:WecB/TagA/CpsF family glycosyltransferase [Clostridium sp. Marseille-P3244]
MKGKIMIAYFNKIYTKGSECFDRDLDGYVQNASKKFIITANPETLMIGRSDPEFDNILKRKDVTIVPDGIGVVKAGHLLGKKIAGRVTGVEIARTLFSLADQYEKSIYLFGAKKEVLHKLVKKIREEYPRAVIAGAQDGYVRDRDKVFEDILEKQPDIVLVALGIPYQELLIGKYFDRFKKGIFVGVGGSFDVLSGTKKRAPKIFIKLNLEWLYRITTEPKRIGRFCRSNIKFLFEIITIRIKRR